MEELKIKEFEKEEIALSSAKYRALSKGIDTDIRSVGWDRIKNNIDLLNWAIETHKVGNRDFVNGISICESILLNYDDVDKTVYQRLIDSMLRRRDSVDDDYYTDIARTREYIWPDGYESSSFLTLALENPTLALTDDQKELALIETHNQPKSIGNAVKVCMVHGMGIYDIRYAILKNRSWSNTEKEELIKCFWVNNEDFKKVFAQWLSDFIENPSNINIKGEKPSVYIMDRNIGDIEKQYKDPKKAQRIRLEVQFFREIGNIMGKTNDKIQKRSLGVWKRNNV